MSAILCNDCGAFCDSDEYPEGYYRGDDSEPSDEFLCSGCNEQE